jgi:hypothetical protein
MERVFLYNITIIARPTLTSAAATIIIKKTKICALVAMVPAKAFGATRCIFENAISKRFTEFNINSMHIKTMIEFRRVSAPITPMQNRITDKNIYHLISITSIFPKKPTPGYMQAGQKISLVFYCFNAVLAFAESFLPINIAPTIALKNNTLLISKGTT